MLLWELSLFRFAGLLREQFLFCLYSLRRIVVTSGNVPFCSPILQELSVLLTEGTIPFTFGGGKSLDAITFGNDPFSHWREISLCAKGTIPNPVVASGRIPCASDNFRERSLLLSDQRSWGTIPLSYSRWFSLKKILMIGKVIFEMQIIIRTTIQWPK